MNAGAGVAMGSFTKHGWHVYTTAQDKRITYWGIPVYDSQAIPTEQSSKWLKSDGSYFFGN